MILRVLRRLLGQAAPTPPKSRARRDKATAAPASGGDEWVYPRRKRPRKLRQGKLASRPERWSRWGLPPIRTREELAATLGITVGQLHWLTWRGDWWFRANGGYLPHGSVAQREAHYHFRVVPKRGGGERVLVIPKPRLKAVQGWILRNILDPAPVSAHAHGFVRGRSIVTNARLHTGRRIVVRAVIRGFFPSIGIGAVKGLFVWLGYGSDVAHKLAMLCTGPSPWRGRRLPQGAPTSPAIANLTAWRMDQRLAGLAAEFGATYTRYADDLTFSGDGELKRGMKRLLLHMRRIVRDEGFQLNRAKLRFARSGSRQLVTGLVVNERPQVPREQRRRLRAILHQGLRDGRLPERDRDGRPITPAFLAGYIAHLHATNPPLADRMKQQLRAIVSRE